MIKTIAISIGSLAAIGVFAYVTRKWWLPLITNPKINENDTDSSQNLIEKEPINILSYEHIVKCVDNVISSVNSSEKIISNAKLIIMPNKLAQDYYNFTQSKSQPFFIKEKMSNEEKGKMVVVLISTSDTLKDVLWGKVYIPNEIAEDFHDFIPSDKIYMRAIVGDRPEVNKETYSDTITKLDSQLEPAIPYSVDKEKTDKLSYEWILNEAKKVLENNDLKNEDRVEYSLIIMPNKFARECYAFCEKNGKKLLKDGELMAEEVDKMVIALIITEDGRNVLWGKLLIPDKLTDDFSDFVPDDKILKKTINLE